MTLTLSSCEDYIRNSLGIDTPAVRSARDITNDAGKFWVAAHSWSYLENTSTSLNITADQDYILLPLGIREIIDLYVQDSLTYYTQEGSLKELDELRTSVISAQLDQYHWAVESRRITPATGEPHQRWAIALWPTRSTDVADAFRVRYKLGWGDLMDDSDAIFMPSSHEAMFIEFLDACARGYEKPGDGGRPVARIEAISRSESFANLQRLDAAIQPTLGIEGMGAANESRYVNIPRWRSFTMSGPNA